MVVKKFLRRDSAEISKLGKNRRKIQTWRRPTGRHNKMREGHRGQPALVSIGYRTEKADRGLIEEKTPVRVFNLHDLESLKKGQIAILSKVGNKKKIEIAKKAKEKGIEISNLNVNVFLRKLNRTMETKK